MKIISAQLTDQSEQAQRLSDLPLPLGRSEAMRRVHDQIRRLTSTDTTTLIYGETGTGKELVARALHRLSRRGTGPYLCVNCGGLRMGAGRFRRDLYYRLNAAYLNQGVRPTADGPRSLRRFGFRRRLTASNDKKPRIELIRRIDVTFGECGYIQTLS